MKRIFTIGHSNRSFNEFLRILKKYRISILIDVRRFPKSKFSWFSKEFLQKNLEKYGIKYLSFPELGALGLGKDKEIPEIPCINSKTYRKYIYNLLHDKNARESIEKIEEFARNRRVCLMCAEKFYWKCHRNFLSDMFLARGYKVIHIIDENKYLIHKGSRCYDYISKRL